MQSKDTAQAADATKNKGPQTQRSSSAVSMMKAGCITKVSASDPVWIGILSTDDSDYHDDEAGITDELSFRKQCKGVLQLVCKVTDSLEELQLVS